MERENYISLGSIKRGATFSYTIELKDTNTGLPLTGLASKLKCHGKYIGYKSILVDVGITETSTPGVYLLFVSSEITKNWAPKKTVLFDIMFTPSDNVDPVDITNTLSIFIEEAVTYRG